MNLYARYLVRATDRWLDTLGAAPLEPGTPRMADDCPVRNSLARVPAYSDDLNVWPAHAFYNSSSGRRHCLPIPEVVQRYIAMFDRGKIPEHIAPAPETRGTRIGEPQREIEITPRREPRPYERPAAPDVEPEPVEPAREPEPSREPEPALP